jgi:hypothetical protein
MILSRLRHTEQQHSLTASCPFSAASRAVHPFLLTAFISAPSLQLGPGAAGEDIEFRCDWRAELGERRGYVYGSGLEGLLGRVLQVSVNSDPLTLKKITEKIALGKRWRELIGWAWACRVGRSCRVCRSWC